MRDFLVASDELTLISEGGRTFYRAGDGREIPVVRGGDGDTPTLDELLAGATDLTGLSDDELTQLDADISAAAEALAEGGIVDDDVLASLTRAGETCQSIRAEQETRDEAAAERQRQADEALAQIRGETGGDDDPEGGEGDEPAEPEVAPAEPEAQAEPEVPAEEPEAVAAGATPAAPRAPRAPRVTRTVPRVPAAYTPTARVAAAPDLASMGLVAAANAPGVTAGAPIRDYDDLARAFVSAFETAKAYRQGPPVKVPIVRAGSENLDRYSDEFTLDSNRAANMRKIAAAQRSIQAAGGIRAALSDEGLVASGGICAPINVSYDMPTIGSDARPVRDQLLTRFGADRGGVATLPMPVLGDLTGAIDIWTEATDQDPQGATKDCLTVTCPDEDETVVEAITRCLEYGNFRSRFFPEQIEAWMRLVAVEHARVAEQRLLATISAGSKAVTAGTVLGTARDVLTHLDRALAIWQYRHRTEDSYTLAWGAPRWLRDQIRSDIARSLPVGSLAETLAVADAEIDRWFAVRNVEPVWLMDGESGQRFNAQVAGGLNPWPSVVKTYLFPAGAWLFLDGGTLDLGIVRDSTLNATNDVQVFAETFEGAHFHGVDSWTLTMDTCPDGSVSATVDINPCTIGS